MIDKQDKRQANREVCFDEKFITVSQYFINYIVSLIVLAIVKSDTDFW